MSHHHVVAVYDISSSSVGGAHALAVPNAQSVILASARKSASPRDTIDTAHLVEDMMRQLSSVSAQIRANDVHQPSSIQVILASPWYLSQTHTLVYKKDTPFTCTKKLVDTLVQTELDRMLKEEEGAFGPFGTQSLIVEKQISAIKLNGYQTNAPFGKEATRLELFLAITIAPKLVLDRISDALRRNYGVRDIRYTTSAFTTYVALGEAYSIREGMVFDIGEEITDVAFIKDDMLLYQHSFPVGSGALYRLFAQETKHTIAESIAIFEAYRFGKLSAKEVSLVQTAITHFMTTWQRGLRTILQDGHYGFCVPEQALVVGDARFEDIFVQGIGTDEFIKHHSASGGIQVTSVTHALLEEHIRSADHTTLDVSLAIGVLYTTRITP